MGCILLLLRAIRRLPRFGIYVLWAIPFVRFWIPVGIANEYSLMSLLSKLTTRTIVAFDGAGRLPELTMMNSIMAADRYFPIEFKTNMLRDVFTVSAIVWIVIFGAAIVQACRFYGFAKSEMKNAVHLQDNIYTSDQISAPAVYGVFRPKIIIPDGVAENYLNYILMHEQVHIGRRDNLLRAVAVVTVCLHWFNPLAWVFLKVFFEDMELACDAKVLKNCDDHQKKEYASALLSCAAPKTLFASSFGSAKIKARIENILSYRKLTAASLVCSILLILAIIIVLITNAVT